MEKFRWGYIGNGNIAYSTAESILKGAHTINAVYGRNIQKAEAFAGRYGAKVFDDVHNLLDSGEIDAVYIATPHTSHIEYAVKSLERKIPVLCEKPVGVSVRDVDTLIKCAKENDTYFAEAMWTWFSDVALKVKEWIKSSAIGDVKSVKINYAFPGVLMPKNSRVLLPQTAGGALLDIGIYPITYCYNLFGFPDKILCSGELKNGIDVAEKVLLTYGNLTCELNMSLKNLKENCVIKGTSGKIKLPVFHMASKAVLQRGKEREVFSGKTDYLTEFTRAADEIKNGKKESEYIPFNTTRDCMKIMDECRRQMNLVYPFER